jgi:hypothetical protein
MGAEAAPAAAAPEPAPVRKREIADNPLDGLDEGRASSPGRSKPPVPTLVVTATASAGLGDTRALRAAIEASLIAARGGCSAGRGGVVLRLTVDAAGKVIAVDVDSGDARLAACLRPGLLGLTSGTRATAKTGAFTVTITVASR